MHKSAIKHGRYFFDTYASYFKAGKVIDIGAQNVNGSMRDVCPAHLTYIGVDFVQANGVDIVLTDPYQLPFEDASIDVIVCSSCLEHSEFFWVLFLEMLRVVRHDGIIYINAPSNGSIHRYPVDAWRFYPDAGQALVAWGKHNGYQPMLLESFVGNSAGNVEEGEDWNDFVAVFVRSEQMAECHPRRIQSCYKDFRNGLMSGSREFVNASEWAEDQSKIATLSQQSRIQTTALAKLETQTASLSAMNDAMIEDKARLSDELSRLKAQLVSASGAVKTLEDKLNATLNSTSWRLTAPFRAIRAALKR